MVLADCASDYVLARRSRAKIQKWLARMLLAAHCGMGTDKSDYTIGVAYACHSPLNHADADKPRYLDFCQ
jgi:hypothetical protein